MAKQIAKYLDNNDNEFDTEAEADASNAFIEAEFSIEAFIVSEGLAKAQAGLVRRLIPAYIAFTNHEDHDDLVEEAKQAALAKVEAAEAAAADAEAADAEAADAEAEVG